MRIFVLAKMKIGNENQLLFNTGKKIIFCSTKVHL